MPTIPTSTALPLTPIALNANSISSPISTFLQFAIPGGTWATAELLVSYDTGPTNFGQHSNGTYAAILDSGVGPDYVTATAGGLSQGGGVQVGSTTWGADFPGGAMATFYVWEYPFTFPIVAASLILMGGGMPTPVPVLTGNEGVFSYSHFPQNYIDNQFTTVSYPTGYTRVNLQSALGPPLGGEYWVCRPRGAGTATVVNDTLAVYDSTMTEIVLGAACPTVDVWRMRY